MKCVDVKKYLSEYIDGKLAGELNEQVEEHLLSCEACSKDLHTIMAIKERLGKMEEVEVPKDFLSSIHRRIEEDSGRKKIFNALFKPARVKIPLELAAGLTAVIVVIVLLNLQPLFKPTRQLAYEKKEAEVLEQKQMDDKPSITKTESYEERSKEFEKQKFEVKEPIQIKKEEGEVGITPPVESMKRTETPIEPVSETQSRSEISPDKEKKPIELVFFIKAAPRDAATGELGDREMAADGVTAKRGERGDRLEETSGKEASLAGAEISAERPSIMDLYVKTKELILESGGRIISSEISEDTGLPLSASVEIPLENYQSFLDKVQKIADMSGPLPPVSFPERKWVQIDIRFYTED